MQERLEGPVEGDALPPPGDPGPGRAWWPPSPLVAGGLAAALVAVAVVASVVVGGRSDGGREAAPSASPSVTASSASPSSTPTASTSTAPGPTVSTSASPTVTPSAAAPSVPARTATTPVPWAAGSTVHLQAGTIDVGDGRQVRRLEPLASGGAAVGTAPGSPGALRWRLHDARGRVVDDLGRPQQVVASRDGRLLAVQKGVDDPVTVLDPRGRRVGAKDVGGSLVAVAGGRVWTATQTGSRGWDVDTGAVRRLDVRLTAVSADGRRGAAVSFSRDGSSRCWRVVDLTRSTPRTIVERCGADNPEGFTPQEFSADGRLVIGTDDADGGFYLRLVVARASDGKVLVGRTVQGEDVDGWSWALSVDGRSILFSRNVAQPRFPASRNDLARCTLELRCTSVADAVRLSGEVTQPRYVVGRPVLSPR